MNTFFLFELANPGANLSVIMPEMIIAITGIVVMVYDSIVPRQRTTTLAISLAGLVVSGFALASMWTAGDNAAATAWSGMVAHDNLRYSFSFVFLFVSAMTILISTVWVEREDVPVGEYHALLLFATFGMMLMASGNDLVIIFLGLETLSIA